MKKLTAVIIGGGLTLGLMTACASQEGIVRTEEGTVPTKEMSNSDVDAENPEDIAVNAGNWGAYDVLIAGIREEKNAAKREALLHEAEDMLMETGAVLPLFYEKDTYMQKKELTGVYANAYGMKYFMFAEIPDKTLTVHLGGEPYSLDPALADSGTEADISVNIFSGLTAFDANGEIQPELASHYEVSGDGRIYTFYLQPDLKWSDGEVLTAEDFVYAWNRAGKEKCLLPRILYMRGIARETERLIQSMICCLL